MCLQDGEGAQIQNLVRLARIGYVKQHMDHPEDISPTAGASNALIQILAEDT